MTLNLSFYLNSILLGAGLAMDAFSVCVANALSDTKMKKGKMCLMAGVFSFFQFFMPLLGWVCVHTLVRYFSAFQPFIPYIALVLLCFLGVKSILESRKKSAAEEITPKELTLPVLLLQAVATSIDALSVGFTIETYPLHAALIAGAVIGAVTFVLCMAALLLGKKFGGYFQKAEMVGGIILIAILSSKKVASKATFFCFKWCIVSTKRQT